MARVLVISDTHYPFSIKGYEEFARSVYKKYKCTQVVHCGDLVDNHAIDSHHEPSAEAKDANTELDEAIKSVKKLCKMFPKVKLVLGNHDLRLVRAAAKVKLTSRMVVPFKELLQLPKGWEIADQFFIDDVKYTHEPYGRGALSIRTSPEKNMRSTVFGHLHSSAGIGYLANDDILVWGMNVGCAIDRTTYAAEYGKQMKDKPIIGVGVVINGFPFYEVMPLGTKLCRK